MRILINALATNRGGSVAYWRGLLSTLGPIDSNNEYFVLRAPWHTFWDFDWPANIHPIDVALPQERSLGRRILWEQMNLPKFIQKHKVDLLYCPTDIATLFAPCVTVLAIRNSNPYLGRSLRHDFVYYLNRKVALRSLTWLSARKASKVIFVSDFSRSIICRQLRIPLKKTTVVHHGLGSVFDNRQPKTPAWLERLPRPYLLTVSNITAHKNFPFLVQVFTEMAQQSNFRHHLVIAGSPVYQEHVDQMWQIAKQAGLEARLHLLGAVAYEELPALYQQADLFVFPSRLETFGHPLVEAMASGVPVVASNASAIPEICGEAALFFDPTDVKDAVENISRLFNDSSLRQQLIAKGKTRASEFSWERTAEETISVFEAAVSEYRSGRHLRD